MAMIAPKDYNLRAGAKTALRMRKLLVIFFTLLVLVIPSESFAHAIGQPPYFKVNGIFTEFYSVPTTSLVDFKLPQDIAVGVFLINQPIEFEIDPTALPVPQEIVDKTKFTWEYGDGAKAEGLKNSYAYTKPGTYFLDIYAHSEGGFEPQLLQSTAINIVPDKNYQLPSSVIEINDKQSKDPLLDIIDVNFAEEIKFSSKSSGGASEISGILWDLGDMTSKTEDSFFYTYKENPYTVFPVLRIKTKDGFIVDSFIQIKDESAFTESASGLLDSIKTSGGFSWKTIIFTVLVSMVLAAGLTWLISKFILKNKA